MAAHVQKAGLQVSLDELLQRRADLEHTIERRTSADLQAWRQKMERRHHPEGYVTIDRRWANPSMRSQGQKRAMDEAAAGFREARRAEVASELARLDGKIERLKRMLKPSVFPVPTGPTPSALDHSTRPDGVRRAKNVCLHPSAARLVLEAGRNLSEPDRAYLLRWSLRHRDALNAALERAIGDRLQLVELFAGIGGLGSGLERALNSVTVLQAERVADRRRVLARQFPMALQIDDVRRLPELPSPAPADRLIVAGGFPCRGASRANVTGKRGMEHEETALWSVMAETIRRWNPVIACFENVASLRSRGLDQVLRDLADAGYSVLWGSLRASDFGAPHERARLFGIAIRAGSPARAITSRPHRSEWLPWSSALPGNDFDAPGQRARAAALGDAVVPIVAYTVGRTAARLLSGWRPALPEHPEEPGELPMNGWLENGRVWDLRESPFAIEVRAPAQRWVTVDERYQAEEEGYDMPLDSCIYPPAMGRIRWWDGESDNVDVELPGGEVMPVPPEWVQHGRAGLWPTPTASDGKNRGGRCQWHRNGPGVNTLVQTDSWLAEDGIYAAELIQLFSGRGVGPSFLEWMQGFPTGWTHAAAEAAHEPASMPACSAEAA